MGESTGLFLNLMMSLVDQVVPANVMDPTDWTQLKLPSAERIKRPLNSFMVYSKAERKKITRDSPDLHHAAISQILGSGWRELTKEQKKPFELIAADLHDQHTRQYPDYKYRPRKKKLATDNPSRKKLAATKLAKRLKLAVEKLEQSQIAAATTTDESRPGRFFNKQFSHYTDITSVGTVPGNNSWSLFPDAGQFAECLNSIDATGNDSLPADLRGLDVPDWGQFIDERDVFSDW